MAMADWKMSNLCINLLFILTANILHVVTCSHISTTRIQEVASYPNPFEKGCLITIAKERNENINEVKKSLAIERFRNITRICNSNDYSEELDLCILDNIENTYDEVRIAMGNWDSTIFMSWMMQILLSELLRVPTTLEFGFNGKKHESSLGSFYDRESSYAYSDQAYGWPWLNEATSKEGDCSETDKPCAHIIPEVWTGVKDGYEKDVLPISKNGLTASVGYYIPRFTAKRYPEFLSHFGLSNIPQKLSDIFKTPITWGQYCEINNCSDPNDGVATRPPSDTRERNKYFLKGSYTGFFKDNQCNQNITANCTGHFVDVDSCTWSTHAENQFYWHNISLASAGPRQPNSGYSIEQVIDIVFAANATRSDVLFYWFQPDMLLSSFYGTPMEFQRVKLTAPSRECNEARGELRTTYIDIMCSNSSTVERRRGSAVTSCDYPVQPLEKVITKGLNAVESDDSISNEMQQSPALDFFKSFELSALSMNDLMTKIFTNPNEDFAYHLGSYHEQIGTVSRRAVCEWVYDNLDDLIETIPSKYPRFFRPAEEDHQTLRKVGLGLSIFTLVLIWITAVLGFTLEIKETMKILRVDCWIWVLIGFILVEASSIAFTHDYLFKSCGLAYWFLFIGRMLHLVPILIKVWTINKMVRFARVHQRADVKPEHLNYMFLAALIATIAFSALWFSISPSDVQKYFTPSNESQHVVETRSFCGVQRNVLFVSYFAVWAVLLAMASVLTFQSRHVFEEFNESQGLAFMMYSHFTFICLHILLFQSTSASNSSRILSFSVVSILISIETILVIIFYFGQKFFYLNKTKDKQITRPTLRYSMNTCHEKDLDPADKAADKDDNDDTRSRSHPFISKFSLFF